MPSFALAILTHNQASELERTLMSLKGSAFDEILILDDCSDSDPTSLVNRLKGSLGFANIQVHLSEVNIGTFENVKRAFSIAKSDFVTLMSADDCLAPEYLSVMQKFATKASKSRVFVPIMRPKSGTSMVSKGVPRFSKFRILNFLRLREFNLSHGGGAIYPRVRVCNSKLYELEVFNLVDDWLVFYLLSESGFKLSKVQETLYFHAVSESLSDIAKRKVRQREFENEIRNIINGRKLGRSLKIAIFIHKILRKAKSLLMIHS